MQFIKTKIESIVSTDPKRPELHTPYLDLSDPGRPYLVACDGQRLVALAIPDAVLDPGDRAGWIPCEALARARKVKAHLDLTASGTVTVAGIAYPRPDEQELTFPDWRQVLPNPERPELRVSFGADLLRSVAKVLDASILTVGFSATDATGPIRVINGDDFACIGTCRDRESGESPMVNCDPIAVMSETEARLMKEIETLRDELEAANDAHGEAIKALEDKHAETIENLKDAAETEKQTEFEDGRLQGLEALDEERAALFKTLKSKPAGNWCDVCSTCNGHAADCLVLAVQGPTLPTLPKIETSAVPAVPGPDLQGAANEIETPFKSSPA